MRKKIKSSYIINFPLAYSFNYFCRFSKIFSVLPYETATISMLVLLTDGLKKIDEFVYK